MTEEEKLFAGQLFCAGDPDLKAIKRGAESYNEYERYEEELEQ